VRGYCIYLLAQDELIPLSATRCRQKLDVVLNRPCMQGLVVTLVFADLLIITVLLLIDLKVIRGK